MLYWHPASVDPIFWISGTSTAYDKISEKVDVNDTPLEKSWTSIVSHPHINNSNVTTKWTSEVGHQQRCSE
jgi:hypothetical protein